MTEQGNHAGHHPKAQAPTHNAPRVWFITDGATPIGVDLTRKVLIHGDYVVLGVSPLTLDRHAREASEFNDLCDEVAGRVEWRSKTKVIRFDMKSAGECQSAIASAIEAFARIDILFICDSEALIGTIEELSQSSRAQSLVTDQFAANFFGPVNIIKSVLPAMRKRRDGHIMLLTGITGHLGTPGLGMYCASQWAIEGYVDSLAYEIAPFNLKCTIVQSNIEVALLTHRIIAVPELPAYAPDVNPAPLARGIVGGLLARLSAETTNPGADNSSQVEQSGPPNLLLPAPPLTHTILYPNLPSSFRTHLTAETVHAVLAVGGHENPPARHIVGFDGVASVKEKLKTVSEELEDFLEVSAAVDL